MRSIHKHLRREQGMPHGTPHRRSGPGRFARESVSPIELTKMFPTGSASCFWLEKSVWPEAPSAPTANCPRWCTIVYVNSSQRLSSAPPPAPPHNAFNPGTKGMPSARRPHRTPATSTSARPRSRSPQPDNFALCSCPRKCQTPSRTARRAHLNSGRQTRPGKEK